MGILKQKRCEDYTFALCLLVRRCGFLCMTLSIMMPQLKISYMSISFQKHNSFLPPTSNITLFFTYSLCQGNSSGNIVNILPLSSKKARSKNIKEFKLTVWIHIYFGNFKYEDNFSRNNGKELLQPLFIGRLSSFLIFKYENDITF